MGGNAYCYCQNNSANYVDYPGTFALASFFAMSVTGAIIGGLVGAVSSIASSLINNEPVKIDKVWEDTKKGAAAGLFTNPVMSTIVSFGIDTAEYCIECKTSGEEIRGEVIAWYGVSNLAGGILGEGISEALSSAPRTLADEGVEFVTDVMISTADDAVSEEVKKSAHKPKEYVLCEFHCGIDIPKGTPGSKMPYLVTIWDASIQKYREAVIYPGKCTCA